MPNKETSTFSHFFKEGHDIVKNIQDKNPDQSLSETVGIEHKSKKPKLRKSADVNEKESRDQWQKIRSFFRNANNKDGIPNGWSPVVLSPLFTDNIIPTDYPIWVNNNYKAHNEIECQSLKGLLENALIDREAPILTQNIERIIHIANEQLKTTSSTFSQLIDTILDSLKDQLEISGDDATSFHADIDYLRKQLPPSGTLIPYSANTSFELLEEAIKSSLLPSINKVKEQTTNSISKLKDLLRIEEEKGPGRKDSDKLQESMAFVDSMVKFDELTSMMPEGGAESMGKERTTRIRRVIEDLQKGNEILDQLCYLFIEQSIYKLNEIDWKNLFTQFDLKVVNDGKGSNSVIELFDEKINSYITFVVACRIAELELDGKYIPEVHNEYFKNFQWHNFTNEELNACGHFVLIIDDTQLFGEEYTKISKLLSKNIPIKIIAIKSNDHIGDDLKVDKEKITNLHTQAELGGLMLSHRNIFVSQTSPITPIQIYNGFTEGLTAFAPAFFYIINADIEVYDNPYLWSSAAIESRDFPGFTFKGLLGTPWGSRFNIDNNPQPERTWPIHQIEIINSDGEYQDMEFTFTFADKALLNSAYHNYFLPVDSAYWNQDLISLSEYIGSSDEETIGKVPFIWMMDQENQLQKIAVSWPMVMATQERLDFWRFLQENSGINNYHVKHAVKKSIEEMNASHEVELQKLQQEQLLEIEKIRNEEADKVMENLTNALLNLDLSSMQGIGTSSQRTPTTPSTEVQNKEEVIDQSISHETVEEEEETLLTSDPYIDTPLCTSCNECINLNGALFNYNADKMAFIADPKAGTFKELVEAAEVCPVGIIHPGTPINPDEAGLDDLIPRAEKFN